MGLDARLIAAHFVTPDRMEGKRGKNAPSGRRNDPRQRAAQPLMRHSCWQWRQRTCTSSPLALCRTSSSRP